MTKLKLQLQFEVAGVDSLLVRLADELDPKLPAFLQALREHLLSAYPLVILQVIPAYTTLLIRYDPRQCRLYDLQLLVERELAAQLEQPVKTGRLVEVPVCYDADFALDLAEVAKQTKLTVEQVVELHTETEFQVHALGFAPGFTYLADLPPALRLPRRTTPRQQVPAGSVAIAERQTAVYPNQSPGGWHVIGRSPMRWFDHQAEPMTPLAVGDRVRFVAISAAAYAEQASANVTPEAQA